MRFGLVVPAGSSAVSGHVDRLVSTLSERLGVQVTRHDAPSYEALVDDVRREAVDVTWLPPIVFLRSGDAVTALGSILRDGSTTYEAALVVQAKSRIRTIDGLRGARAGWVDRWSASGFVLPRMNLALRGVDPRTIFKKETFHGSHRSTIQALAAGLCDVVGTYARADDSGQVTTGAWSEVEGASVRVLTTFGAIPPDVLGVRSTIATEDRARVLNALKDLATSDDGRTMLKGIFGGDALREGLAPGYESLRAALDMATSQGIFG
jgi:phosphate/phosphite/phosphonate ABC transporter binding protein